MHAGTVIPGRPPTAMLLRALICIFIQTSTFATAPPYPADVLVSTCPPDKHRKVVEYAQDCRKYIYCFDGRKYYFRCYDGFVFDPCLKRCVYSNSCIPKELCPNQEQPEFVGNLAVSPSPKTNPPVQQTDIKTDDGNLFVNVRHENENRVDVMDVLPALPNRIPVEQIFPLVNDDPGRGLGADDVLIEVSGESKKPPDDGNLQVNVKTQSEPKVAEFVSLSTKSNEERRTTLGPPPVAATSAVRDNTYIIRVVFSPKEKPEDVYDTGVEEEIEKENAQPVATSTGQPTPVLNKPPTTIAPVNATGSEDVMVTGDFTTVTSQDDSFTINADNLVSSSDNEVAQVLDSEQQQDKVEVEELLKSNRTDSAEGGEQRRTGSTTMAIDSEETLTAVIDQLKNDTAVDDAQLVNSTQASVPFSTTDLIGGSTLADDQSLVNATIDGELNSNATLASYALMMINNAANNNNNSKTDSNSDNSTHTDTVAKKQFTIVHNKTVKPDKPETRNQMRGQDDMELDSNAILPPLCNLTAAGTVCDCATPGGNSSESLEEVESRCSQLACLNGGMYVTLSNGHCGCVCPIGYKGNRCEQLTDPTQCFCANGGKCVEMAQDASAATRVYSCQCPLGYLGGQCQYRIDAIQRRAASLLSNPARDPRSGGRYGESRIDLTKYKFCDINPCLNGGFCLQHIESLERQCYCTNNFGGVLCQRKCRNC